MGAVKDTPARTYGGRTADERAAARCERLVDAAFALVAEDGWRQLTVETLCRRAALNKRYFYETFDTLDAVIAAVTTRLADDAIACTLAVIDADAAPDTAVREAISAFTRHLTEDPRRARVLFGAVPAGDAAAGHRTAAVRQIIATVARQGRSLHALDDAPVVDVTAAMLVGGTSQVILDWLDGRIACSRDTFIDHLVAHWQGVGNALAGGPRPADADRPDAGR